MTITRGLRPGADRTRLTDPLHLLDGATHMNNTAFFHAVYFYGDAGATAQDAQALIDGCRKHLPGIAGITFFEVGLPAGTQRDVVDNSYLVALLVGYESSEAHDRYQDHPDHLRFIDENKHLWSRVVVFDTLAGR